MSRLWTCALVSLVLLPSGALAEGELSADEIVARYVEARGGEDRWSEATSIHMRGIYATFSDHEAFELVRASGDRYRLDFRVLGGEAIRARDAQGPWWRHPLLQPETARLEDGPYKALVERESLFIPPLFPSNALGVAVEFVGHSEVDGIPVLELLVRLPGEAEEHWYLDPDTYLEVAIDSQVNDFTQSADPMRQRAFFDDFREIGGLMLPFRVEYEFGHRLESMTVEAASVGEPFEETRLSPPAQAAPSE